MVLLKVPVFPYVSSSGAVVSLQGVAPEGMIVLSGNAPKQLPPSPHTHFEDGLITETMAANAGFSGLASVKVSNTATYVLGEFIAWCPAVPGAASSVIKTEYYGVGYRVCAKAWSLQGNAAISLAGVAAQCTTNGASSCYEIQFYGIGLTELAPISPFIAGGEEDAVLGRISKTGRSSSAGSGSDRKPTGSVPRESAAESQWTDDRSMTRSRFEYTTLSATSATAPFSAFTCGVEMTDTHTRGQRRPGPAALVIIMALLAPIAAARP